MIYIVGMGISQAQKQLHDDGDVYGLTCQTMYMDSPDEGVHTLYDLWEINADAGASLFVSDDGYVVCDWSRDLDNYNEVEYRRSQWHRAYEDYMGRIERVITEIGRS